MAKFSHKMMGKEVGSAEEYAVPHNMKGKAISPHIDSYVKVDPNSLKAGDVFGPETGLPRVSLGNPGANDVETAGIKIRGTGAATKGVMARGPMA
jgi:hypothetical protein